MESGDSEAKQSQEEEERQEQLQLIHDPCIVTSKNIFWAEKREFATGARTPDCPYSLYEGVSGTALFLADLSKPEEAAFPFMDVVNP